MSVLELRAKLSQPVIVFESRFRLADFRQIFEIELVPIERGNQIEVGEVESDLRPELRKPRDLFVLAEVCSKSGLHRRAVPKRSLPLLFRFESFEQRRPARVSAQVVEIGVLLHRLGDYYAAFQQLIE